MCSLLKKCVIYLLTIFYVLRVSSSSNTRGNEGEPNGRNTQLHDDDVTFTDTYGQKFRIILNRTVTDNEYFPFSERSRENAFDITKPSENPYSVLIITVHDKVAAHSCSGSLLTPEWVLTSAFCLHKEPKPDELIVYAGGNCLQEIVNISYAKGSQLIKTKEFFSHPDYDGVANADIALVKVRPFTLTETVNVANVSTEPWAYHSYRQCKVTSFGVIRRSTELDRVRKTHTVLVKKPCLCSFMLRYRYGASSGRFICNRPLQDYGLCPGDLGGGLVCDGVLKGIASTVVLMRDFVLCDFYILKPSGPYCGSQNSITIFQDTCSYLRWINFHVKLFNDSEISAKCVYTGNVATKLTVRWTFYILLVSIVVYIF